MFKRLALIVALVMMSFAGTANAALPDNSVYLEGLGNGGLFSVNYERVVLDDFGVRVGFGNLFGIHMIPTSFNWLGLRSDNDAHMLELGVGATVAVVSEAIDSLGIKLSGTAAFMNTTVGYRFQGDWFQFRLGLNPWFNFTADTDAGESMAIFLPYISFGGGF